MFYYFDEDNGLMYKLYRQGRKFFGFNVDGKNVSCEAEYNEITLNGFIHDFWFDDWEQIVIARTGVRVNDTEMFNLPVIVNTAAQGYYIGYAREYKRDGEPCGKWFKCAVPYYTPDIEDTEYYGPFSGPYGYTACKAALVQAMKNSPDYFDDFEDDFEDDFDD